MRVVTSLHDFLTTQRPQIHQARLNALMTNVDALMRGRKLTVTGLGRAPGRHRHTKHDIKQSDRLIGNVHLNGERQAVYRAVTQLRILAHPDHRFRRMPITHSGACRSLWYRCRNGFLTLKEL